MSLLFVDGFDHYSTAALLQKWSSGSSPAFITGRLGVGQAIGWTTNAAGANKSLEAAVTTLVAGFAVNTNSISAGGQGFFAISDSAGTRQLTFYITAAGEINVYRNTSTGTLLGTTSGAGISVSEWNYVEIKSTCNNTTGSVYIRVNGVLLLTVTEVDTQNSALTNYQIITILNSNTSVATYFDDLYLCDSAGSANNDFLGDCRVDTIYPNGDGNYTAFTPSTGSSHYVLVDEATPNTADYNDGVSVGDRDSYAFQNLPALSSQTVYGVQVNAAVNKDDAGSKSASTFARSVSTNTDGASAALSTSQAYLSQVYEQDPNAAAAWTEATVNAAEFGVRVTA